MDKLSNLLKTFREDENWNTPYGNGNHRFDKEIAWIEQMVKEYADALGTTTDKVVDLMERGRTYSWPNYYQEANFPGLSSDRIYGVFETLGDFHKHSELHWRGFRCPKCGDISHNPQECIHRRLRDGKCDWCAYGLFRSGKGVVILQNGLDLIPIFEPVPKEG
jgi:hypothetical protein